MATRTAAQNNKITNSASSTKKKTTTTTGSINRDYDDDPHIQAYRELLKTKNTAGGNADGKVQVKTTTGTPYRSAAEVTYVDSNTYKAVHPQYYDANGNTNAGSKRININIGGKPVTVEAGKKSTGKFSLPELSTGKLEYDPNTGMLAYTHKDKELTLTDVRNALKAAPRGTKMYATEIGKKYLEQQKNGVKDTTDYVSIEDYKALLKDYDDQVKSAQKEADRKKNLDAAAIRKRLDEIDIQISAMYKEGGYNVGAKGQKKSDIESYQTKNDIINQLRMERQSLLTDLQYAEAVKTENTYKALANNADFVTKADEGKRAYYDDISANINAEENPFVRGVMAAQEEDTQNGNGFRTDYFTRPELSKYTEDEKNTFYYLYATDKDEAEKYWQYINRKYAEEEEQRKIKETYDWAVSLGDNNIFPTIAAYGTGLVQGLDYIGDAIDYAAYGRIKPSFDLTDINETMQSAALANIDARFTIGDKEIDANGAVRFLYGTGLSILNSRTLVGALGKYASIPMALSSASSATKSALAKGATDQQAITIGFWNGVAEAAFEEISIEHLLNAPNYATATKKELIRFALEQAAVEASEEFNTTLANTISDAIVMGNLSDYNVSYNEYRAKGLTMEEARKKAQADWLSGIILDALGGFISGGVMGGVPTAFEIATRSGTNQQLKQQAKYLVDTMTADEKSAENLQKVLDEGLNAEEGSKTKALADEIANKQKAGETVSKESYYALTESIIQDGNLEDIRFGMKYVQAITGENMEQEVSPASVAALDKVQSGQLLTDEEKAALDSDPVAQRYYEATTGREYKTGEAMTQERYNEVLGIKNEEKKTGPVEMGTAEEIREDYSEQYGKELAGLMANDILEGKQEIASYANSYNEVYELAKSGVPLENIQKAMKGSVLTPYQVQRAYTFGRGKRAFAQQQYQNNAGKVRAKNPNAGRVTVKNGLTIDQLRTAYGRKFAEATGRKQSEAYKLWDQNIRAIQELAKILQYEIRLTDEGVETNKNGRRVFAGANGQFGSAEPGVIEVSVTAGMVFEDDMGNLANHVMVQTLAHELVHAGRFWAKKDFDALQNLVFKYIDKNGGNIRDLVDEQMLIAKENGNPISRDVAAEEVVAQAMTDMLLDERVVNDMAEQLANENPSLIEKIVKAIDNFISRIKAFMKGNSYKEAQLAKIDVNGMLEYAEDLRKAFADMTVTAARNMQAAKEADAMQENGVSIEGSNVVLQLRQWDTTGEKTLRDFMTEKYGEETAEELVSYVDGIADIIRDLTEHSDESGLTLFSKWQNTDVLLDENGHPIFSSSVKNGEYKLNQDFSRVCKKRRQLDYVLNMLAEDPRFQANDLKREDFVKINNIIRNHGFEVACSLCFVDSKRFRQSEWARSFAVTWNTLLESVLDGQTLADVSEFNFASQNPDISDTNVKINKKQRITFDKYSFSEYKIDITKKTYKDADELIAKEGNSNIVNMMKLIINHPELRHKFRAADILASNGFDTAQKMAPEIRSILDGWGGSSVPKPSTSDTMYDNSIINMTEYNKDNAFSVGGVRMQSFSDFLPHMFLDYVQAFADLEAKGLPMHAYTKELVFARLFGLNGGRINLSLVPFNSSRAIHLKSKSGKAFENEKRFAGLDTTRLEQALGKSADQITDEEARANLDLLDYVWADESIDYKRAVLLQTGILYDKMSQKLIDSEVNLIRNDRMNEAIEIAKEIGAFDETYANYVGTIAVAVSDLHALKLMADPTIRMVIPYHKSGIDPKIADQMKIAIYNDFTKYQKTGIVLNGKTNRSGYDNKTMQSMFHLVDFDWYASLSRTKDARASAQEYLDWCENGEWDDDLNAYVYRTRFDRKDGYILADDFHQKARVIPAFEQLAYNSDGTMNSGYYKVLEDFDAYNTITEEYVPQDAVSFKDSLPADYKDILMAALKEEQANEDDLKKALETGWNRKTGKYESQSMAQEIINAIYGEDADYRKIPSLKVRGSTMDFNAQEKGYVREQARDADYMAAVERGDMETAQRMVDEAAKEAGYTVRAYHGSNKYFTVFDNVGRKGSSSPDGAYFFSTNSDIAYSYTFEKNKVNLNTNNNFSVYNGFNKNGEREENRVYKGGLYESYLKINNPFTVDFEGKRWSAKVGGKDINEWAKYAKDRGYDGLIAKNIIDQGDMGGKDFNEDVKFLVADDYVVFSSSQIKSADPVTYDDDGNVIPLSERFNEGNEDIRYQSRIADSSQSDDSETNAVMFQRRTDPEPQKTKKAYKLMRLENGKLYPLFIGNTEPVDIGVWYDAESPNLSNLVNLDPGTHLVNIETGDAITWSEYATMRNISTRSQPNVSDVHWASNNGYRFMEIVDKSGEAGEADARKRYGGTRAYYNWGVNGSSKSKSGEGSASLYALRPGWHFGEVPSMRQIGYSGGKEDKIRLDNQVWVEVEMAADIDYNEEAKSNPTGDIPTHIPVNGYYEYATNPTQKRTKSGNTEADKTKANWYVSGAFKVNRIISDTEADEIVNRHNADTGSKVPLDYRRKGGRVFDPDTMSLINRQYRSSSMPSDIDILIEASEDVRNNKAGNFSQKEINALNVVYDRLQKIKSLREKRADYREKLNKAMAKENPDRIEVNDLSAYVRAYSSQITDQENYVLKLAGENVPAAKSVLKTARQNAVSTAVQAEKAKSNALATALRKMRDEKVAEAEARGRERLREYRENRDESETKVAVRRRIQKKVNTLYDWLTTDNQKKHVPDALKQVVGEFIESIDFRTTGETKKDKAFAVKMNALADFLTKQMKNNGNENYVDLPDGFDDEVSELSKRITEAATLHDGWSVMSLGSEDLKQLDDILRVVMNGVKEMNTLIVNASYKTAIEAANSTYDELGEMTEHTGNDGNISKLFAFEDRTPVFAFEKLGKAASSMFKEIQKGWSKFAINISKVIDFAENTYTAKEAINWQKEIHDIELSSGKTIRMTTAQMMAFYCTSKREQGLNHLLGDGVRIADIVVDKKIGKKTIHQTEPYLLTIEDVQKINAELAKDKRAVEVADKLQAFMGEYGARLGNEISFARWGIRQFGKEENYFPITVDLNALIAINPDAKENELFRLLNISPTKGIVKGAKNAIVIGDIFEIFSHHMEDMTKYNALALPILDMVKWYNFNEVQKDEFGNKTGVINTKRSIERAFGLPGKSYVYNFIKDINGVSNGGRGTGLISALVGNAKVAAVGANLRVALLQPTSYVRAAAVIPAKYMAKAKLYAPKEITTRAGWKEALKYSGLAIWKYLGYYDVNIGRRLSELIMHTETAKDVIDDWAMKPAEFGDQITWGQIWIACKMEQQDRGYTGDELFEKTAERFDDVIVKTQVMDSTLTRSDIMRNKDGWAKTATAFLSEPTLSLNILLEQWDRVSEDMRKGLSARSAVLKNGNAIVKSTGAVVLGSVVSALAESLADAVRDDDDDEFIKKLQNALFGDPSYSGLKRFYDSNLGSDISIINKIPVLKGVVNEILGYGNSDMANTIFEDIIAAYKAIGSDSKTRYGKLYAVAQAFSSASGIPVSNAMRDAVAIYNTAVQALGYPELKFRKTEGKYQQLYYAMDKNNGANIKKEIQKLLDGGTEAKTIKSAITRTYKDEYIVSTEAQRAEIRKAMAATGLYGGANGVIEACNKWLKNK